MLLFTPAAVWDRFTAHTAHTGQLGISSSKHAELTNGVQKSQQRTMNRAALECFRVRVEDLLLESWIQGRKVFV